MKRERDRNKDMQKQKRKICPLANKVLNIKELQVVSL